MSPSSSWPALGYLLGAGALLGLNTNLARLAAQVGVGPFALLAWSCAGAAVTLLGVASLRRRAPSPTAPFLRYSVVAALLGVVGPSLLFYAAVAHVKVGVVAIALAFPPLLTYLGALGLGMERFARARAVGVLLALVGAATLALLELTAPDADVPWLVAVAVGPFLLAAGNIYRTRAWPPGVAADALAPGMLAAAAAMMLVAGLTPAFSLHVPAGLTPAAIVAAHAVSLSLMYTLYFRLQRRGGPVLLSLLGSVAAVVGVPAAIVVLDEDAPRGLPVAAGFIVTGVALVVGGARRAQTP